MDIRLGGGVKASAFERLILQDPGYRVSNATHTEPRLDGWPSSGSGFVTLESIWRKHLINSFCHSRSP